MAADNRISPHNHLNEPTNESDATFSTQKLCVRDDEFALLLEAYDTAKSSGSDNFVLISGPSGCGKTSLANTLQSRVIQEGGIYLSGKFELTQSHDPYAVFVSLLTNFTNSVMGTDRTVSDELSLLLRETTKQAVGKEGGLLTQFFPPLANFIGEQEKTESVVGNEAKHRFHFVVCQFIRAISALCPLVLFFDDIQWSDHASLDLLQAIFDLGKQSFSQPNSGLMCILSVRDAGTKATTTTCEAPELSLPFHSFLDDIRSNTRFTEIQLQDFNEMQLNEFLSAILKLPAESTLHLTQVVYTISNGNIFRSLQVLRQLHKDRILIFDLHAQIWTWHDSDLCQVSSKTADEGAQEITFQDRLRNVSPFTLEVLQAAACMADVLDELALAIVKDNQVYEINLAVQEATREDLLYFSPQTGFFSFAHDQIREAVLLSISDADDLSFQIGYKLMKQSSEALLDTIIFLVVNLLNRRINQMHDRQERYHAAKLNLEAGLKAASSAAFPDAYRCFESGIKFLKGGPYWTEQHHLSLDLYNNAADAALCCQQFEKVNELVTEIYANTRDPKSKIQAQVIQIQAIGQRNRLHEAVRAGLDVLKGLGVTIPPQPSQLTILWDILKTQILLKGLTSDAMLAFPMIEDKLIHGAIHLLHILFPYTFQAGSPISVLFATRLIQLCLRYGMCKECSLGFVTLSWIIGKNDKAEGYRIGRMGLSIVEKLGARELIPRTHTVFYFFTSHWTRPIGESLAPLQNAYQIAMEVGDIEYAMYAACFHCVHATYSGIPLPQVQRLVAEAQSKMRLYKQDHALDIISQLHHFVNYLTANATDEPKIQGDEFHSENTAAIILRLILGTILAHLFGDLELAERLAHERQDLKRHHFASYTVSVDDLLKGVIAIGRARRGYCRRRNINIARRCLKRMRGLTKSCSENFLNKQMLLEAEILSLSSRKVMITKTNELYGGAYRIALQQGFLYEAAMTCELAGDFMHLHQNAGLAGEYWEQAYSLYVEWGAETKARHFRSRIDRHLNIANGNEAS